jgi:hypothetical protein
MMNTNDSSATASPPGQAPALVLERWNSWVRVFLPDSGEIRWVDLGQVAFDSMQADSQPAPPV